MHVRMQHVHLSASAPNVPPHREEAAISGEISGTLARPETLALLLIRSAPYPPSMYLCI